MNCVLDYVIPLLQDFNLTRCSCTYRHALVSAENLADALQRLADFLVFGAEGDADVAVAV